VSTANPNKFGVTAACWGSLRSPQPTALLCVALIQVGIVGLKLTAG
jgi:hypothetical protein